MVRVVKQGHNGILALSHTTPLLQMSSTADRKVSSTVLTGTDEKVKSWTDLKTLLMVADAKTSSSNYNTLPSPPLSADFGEENYDERSN